MMAVLEFLYAFRIDTFIIGLILPFIIYWYSTRNFDFWAKRNVPFVKPYPFIGTLWHNMIAEKNMEDIESERQKKYGRMYGIFEGNLPKLMISDPEILKKILVKDFQFFTTRVHFPSGHPIIDNMLTVVEGENWRRIRAIVSPTFSTGKIKKVMSFFQDCSKTLLQNFKIASNKDEAIDVLKGYEAFTMDVIASSAFSTKIDSHNDPENQFVRNAREAINQRLGLKIILFLFMPKLFSKLGIRPFATHNLDFFKKVTLEIIEERKRTGQTRNDFLQLLMDTAKEKTNEEAFDDVSDDIVGNYQDDSMNHRIFKNISSKHLSMDELAAQCAVFFLAGYHTTATVLCVATYYLALYPDVQEKAFKEIMDVLNQTNGEFTYESVQKMKYLDNIISEALRIHSPNIRLDRIADADYKLGDITIPKGTGIGVPTYAMQRDPEFFPEPEKFHPDRFSPEGKEKQIPYTYLPFGAGPRNCVGMRFALLNIKVCLTYVLSSFIVKKCQQTKVPLEFGKPTSLLLPKSAYLKMIPRENCPLMFEQQLAY